MADVEVRDSEVNLRYLGSTFDEPNLSAPLCRSRPKPTILAVSELTQWLRNEMSSRGIRSSSFTTFKFALSSQSSNQSTNDFGRCPMTRNRPVVTADILYSDMGGPHSCEAKRSYTVAHLWPVATAD